MHVFAVVDTSDLSEIWALFTTRVEAEAYLDAWKGSESAEWSESEMPGAIAAMQVVPIRVRESADELPNLGRSAEYPGLEFIGVDY